MNRVGYNSLEDHVSKRFGRWLVISRAPSRKKETMWLCLCDCGTQKEICARSLKHGNSKSCGCWAKELQSYPEGEGRLRVHYAFYKRHSIERTGKSFPLSLEEFRIMVQQPCFYCGSPPKYLTANRHNGGVHAHGIDRINSTRGYDYDNMVTCCFTCNKLKSSMFQDQFLSQIKAIFECCKEKGVL